MTTLGHQFQMDSQLKAWAPVLGDRVVTTFSCTCGDYSNMVSEPTPEASQARARRMHNNHKAIATSAETLAHLMSTT